MAKVTIVADTETGEISCDVNGKVLDNVSDCSLYSTSRYDYDSGKEKPCARFYASMKPVKEDGVTTYMSAQATVNPEAEAHINSRKCEFLTDDVILIKDHSKVSNDIAKALKVIF